MNPCIRAVPVEILSHIFSFVDSTETLINAALCSKTWKEIGTPHLYRRIEISKSSDDAVYRDKLDEQPNNRLRNLTLLFLRKPELSKHVRHFSIRPDLHNLGSLYPFYLRSPPRKTLRELLDSEHLEDEIKEAIAAWSMDEMEHTKWLEGAATEDAMVALLVPRFVNLESLDIEGDLTTSDSFTRRMLSRIAGHKKPFNDGDVLTRLKNFVWLQQMDYIEGQFSSVGFLLPSVKNIFFHFIGTEDETHTLIDLMQVPPRSSACTHLELKYCWFGTTAIEPLLNIPKALTTFIYEMVPKPEHELFVLSVKAIRDALEIQKDSLENIWLTYPPYHELTTRDSNCMKSLASFVKLRRLTIAADFVFGQGQLENAFEDEPRVKLLADFLPANLEVLHICRADVPKGMPWLLYAGLEYLLQEITRFPRLHMMKLETSALRYNVDKHHLLRLIRLSQAACVTMRFFNNTSRVVYEGKVERGWGMDGEIHWAPCTSGFNMALPCNEIEYVDGVWLEDAWA